MYLTEVKERVLVALTHGPLNEYDIAYELDEAPFRIRTELKELVRDRLARERLDRNGTSWEITERGHWQLNGEEIPDFPRRGGVVNINRGRR